MIRIAPCTFVAALLFAPTVLGLADEVDDSIRFVVARPSTVAIERTPSGGWRVTIEPLGPQDDPSLPVPPKPDPNVPDPIGDALAILPPADRVVVANLLVNQAEQAIAALARDHQSFRGADVEIASSWLIATVAAKLGPALTPSASEAITGVAEALPGMPGGALTTKLEEMNMRLEQVVE